MEEWDVAVVGGGLVGCAAAYYLTKSGARVILIERGDLNREASGRNAGSLHFQLEHRLIRYGNELAAQFARIFPLTLTAMQDWRSLEDELDCPLEVEMHGGLIVAESQEDIELLELRQALHTKWGLETQLLSFAETHRIAPYLADSVIGATYCADEGHANPRLVTLAFARRASGLGAEILANIAVDAIGRSGSAWHLRLRDRRNAVQEIRARKILNAAGAWCADIAAMTHLHLPLLSIPLLMNVVERSPKFIPHMVQHTSERLSIKQVADGNILIGGGWPGRFARSASKVDRGARAEVVVSNVIRNLELATRLIPGLKGLHLIRSWAGATAISTDQMPLLGEVPEAPGFFVAAGGSAFTHGPTYARLIAELMLNGRTSQPIDMYSPSRFSHINAFMVAGAA